MKSHMAVRADPRRMPTELVDGVHEIELSEDLGRLRSYLLTDGTPTLFDTGYGDTGDALVSGIEAVGVPPERVVITHGDPDHTGGLDAVVDAFGVEVWLPDDVSEKADHIVPDRRYSDGDDIGRFEAVHLPGHTPGSSALIDEAAGVAVLGDALVGADWRGLPSGYLVLPPAGFSADLDAAERSLDKLLDYEFDVGLVYHGDSVTERASEKVRSYVEYDGKPY